eukprot:m.127499 g.127499  ORF g.127499 m.127499 type:complete len:434 (-) comp16708_c2_seq2:299-1600(-)
MHGKSHNQQTNMARLVASWVALLAVCVAAASAQSAPALKTLVQLGRNKLGAMQVDPTNGNVTGVVPLDMPEPSAGCSWEIAGGTIGQTSSVFYMNQSWFVMAQELCSEGQIGDTVLYDIMGPFGNYARLVNLTILSPSMGLQKQLSFSLNWDWTCNVALVAPSGQAGGEITFQTLQVSVYDGAVRPQASFLKEPATCEDCWRKRDGPSAMDNGNGRGDFADPMAINCGDSCAVYYVDDWHVGTSGPLPSRLVGRSFRLGTVLYNETAPLDIQTFTYSRLDYSEEAPARMFFGIGVCCVEEWCLPGCQTSGGQQVLFTFRPNATLPVEQTYTILAVLGQPDVTAAKLGVTFNMIYDVASDGPSDGGRQAAKQGKAATTSEQPSKDDLIVYVLYNGHVVTFDLSYDKAKQHYVVASQTISAGQIPQPLAWGPSRG